MLLKRVDRIAAAAVVYFEGLKDRSREHRAEWIYHRLLSGSDIEDVAPDITPEIFQALAGAEEHFGRNSEAASYIASRCQCIFLEPYEIDGLTRPILRTHTYWIARITPSLSDFQKAEILPHYLPEFAGDWSVGEPGMRSTVQALAIARLCKSPMFAKIDKRLAELLRHRKPNPIASSQASLRTAIVLGDTCRGPALDLWLTGRRRGTAARVLVPTLSPAELRALARIDPGAESLLQEFVLEKSDAQLRLVDEQMLSHVSRLIEQFLSSPSGRFGDTEAGRGIARLFAC